MTLYELITKHEGRTNKPYKCPAGHMTIGIGWNMDANPLPLDVKIYLAQNGKITAAMIDRLLSISVGRAISDCHSLFPEFDSFSDARRMALADFVFQLGFKRASTFRKAIAAINTGRWEDAAKEMQDSAWFKQTPNRAKTIIEMIEEG